MAIQKNESSVSDLDDDYTAATLGDPGLALRIKQLELLRNGEKSISGLDETILLAFTPEHEQNASDSNFVKQNDLARIWPGNILQFFNWKTKDTETGEPLEIREAS